MKNCASKTIIEHVIGNAKSYKISYDSNGNGRISVPVGDKWHKGQAYYIAQSLQKKILDKYGKYNVKALLDTSKSGYEISVLVVPSESFILYLEYRLGNVTKGAVEKQRKKDIINELVLPEIHILGLNQYEYAGEIYPTMRDAIATQERDALDRDKYKYFTDGERIWIESKTEVSDEQREFIEKLGFEIGEYSSGELYLSAKETELIGKIQAALPSGEFEYKGAIINVRAYSNEDVIDIYDSTENIPAFQMYLAGRAETPDAIYNTSQVLKVIVESIIEQSKNELSMQNLSDAEILEESEKVLQDPQHYDKLHSRFITAVSKISAKDIRDSLAGIFDNDVEIVSVLQSIPDIILKSYTFKSFNSGFFRSSMQHLQPKNISDTVYDYLDYFALMHVIKNNVDVFTDEDIDLILEVIKGTKSFTEIDNTSNPKFVYDKFNEYIKYFERHVLKHTGYSKMLSALSAFKTFFPQTRYQIPNYVVELNKEDAHELKEDNGMNYQVATVFSHEIGHLIYELIKHTDEATFNAMNNFLQEMLASDNQNVKDYLRSLKKNRNYSAKNINEVFSDMVAVTLLSKSNMYQEDSGNNEFYYLSQAMSDVDLNGIFRQNFEGLSIFDKVAKIIDDFIQYLNTFLGEQFIPSLGKKFNEIQDIDISFITQTFKEILSEEYMTKDRIGELLTYQQVSNIERLAEMLDKNPGKYNSNLYSSGGVTYSHIGTSNIGQREIQVQKSYYDFIKNDVDNIGQVSKETRKFLLINIAQKIIVGEYGDNVSELLEVLSELNNVPYNFTFVDNMLYVFDKENYVENISQKSEGKSNLPTSNETINIYAGNNQNTELSNFAIRPFTTNVETPSGEKQYTFQSVEQGFHFHKALIANNAQVAKQVLETTNGGQLKRLTSRNNLKMTPEQVKEWDDTSKSIMLNLMYNSYIQNPKAAEKLLATGDAKITHTQDNTRWKTDFPDVVMTVRDMLREEGFGVQSQINPEIEKLFDENPELANQVYEALGLIDEAGFKKTSKYEMSLGEAKFTGVEPFTKSEQEQINKLNNQQKQQALQVYSQYLDTIFPDSKVKDIVYHGSPKNKLEKIEGISFWTNTKGNAYAYNIERNVDNSEGFVTSAIVNVKNPFVYQEDVNSRFATTTPTELINKAKSKNADGAIWKDVEDIGGRETQTIVFEPEQIHILGSKADIKGFKNYVNNRSNRTQYQLPQGREIEEFVASEKTIRDLAARMSDRIGIPVKFESDRTKQYKGKLENNTAYINLAYATLDTPIHEILGHPIIRTIKKKTDSKAYYEISESTDKYTIVKNQLGGSKVFNTKQEAEDYIKNENTTTLYQNLLKELEYGKGKEVFDRVKRDYVIKDIPEIIEFEPIYLNDKTIFGRKYEVLGKSFDNRKDAENYQKEQTQYYTLEEQQEEAIVELLGLYTADRLDKVKDGKLISLLKRLLKEMKAFMRSLFRQKEVEIDKLPDNITLGNIADLLAYRNSKLILPGNEVVYITPDNQQFKTYQEASNHISKLAKNVEEVDLSNINISQQSIKIENIPNEFSGTEEYGIPFYVVKLKDKWFVNYDRQLAIKEGVEISEEKAKDYFRKKQGLGLIKDFIDKNKEYEQSKEIIEEWKRVNNIQYNPEEVYSRGQEFYHIHNAYSSYTVDTELWIQNLLDVIENKKKLNASIELSFATAPVGEVGKGLQYHNKNSKQTVYIVAYPKSEDVKFASQIDNYTSSFTDLTPDLIKSFTNKRNEEVGIAFTKSVSLRNLNTIQSNLATIVDAVAHHNEVVIGLTPQNFRIKYEENVPYRLKKLINNFNSILDQKYGKLEKPNIEKKQTVKYGLFSKNANDILDEFNTFKEAQEAVNVNNQALLNEGELEDYSVTPIKKIGIQPTQTNETLKESIESIRNRLVKFDGRNIDGLPKDKYPNQKIGDIIEYQGVQFKITGEIEEDVFFPASWKVKPIKEYTEQALINTKIAKLKEVAKKYPRSLIRSEVRPINSSNTSSEFELGNPFFQKVESFRPKTSQEQFQELSSQLFDENPELANNAKNVIEAVQELENIENNIKFGEAKMTIEEFNNKYPGTDIKIEDINKINKKLCQ